MESYDNLFHLMPLVWIRRAIRTVN